VADLPGRLYPKVGETFAHSDQGKGKRVQVEFVSANPTGPLHVGNGRGAILGSALANVLTAAGYEVEQEYYINDAGTQINIFYRSLYARYCQALNIDVPMPPDGYQGTYITDLAREIITEQGDKFSKLPEAQAEKELGKIGLNKMLSRIRADLELLRVNFELVQQTAFGTVSKVMDILRKDSFLTEKGTTWFVSTASGR
jgi:arginyl-tRNA synthetase